MLCCVELDCFVVALFWFRVDVAPFLLTYFVANWCCCALVLCLRWFNLYCVCAGGWVCFNYVLLCVDFVFALTLLLFLCNLWCVDGVLCWCGVAVLLVLRCFDLFFFCFGSAWLWSICCCWLELAVCWLCVALFSFVDFVWCLLWCDCGLSLCCFGRVSVLCWFCLALILFYVVLTMFYCGLMFVFVEFIWVLLWGGLALMWCCVEFALFSLMVCYVDVLVSCWWVCCRVDLVLFCGGVLMLCCFDLILWWFELL